MPIRLITTMTFRLRRDLDRVRLGEFSLPLGIDPVDRRPPVQGYTVTYNSGEDEDPDTYTFHIVVSHELLQPVVEAALALLPPRVSPIVEVDSYDAYRTVDVYIGREDEQIALEEFLGVWREYAPILLEDGAIGAGANSEEPFIEVFLDQWKGLSIHVPLAMRERVGGILHDFGLKEVGSTWPQPDGEHTYDATIRPVLDLSSEDALSLDDFVLELRRRWRLELNVDPTRNLDESGRELGVTLWHAQLVVRGSGDDNAERTAYLQVWASAESLTELERLIDDAMDEYPEWSLYECFAVTRVAFDDRPDELEHLKPRRSKAEVHLVVLEEIEDSSESAADGHGNPDA